MISRILLPLPLLSARGGAARVDGTPLSELLSPVTGPYLRDERTSAVDDSWLRDVTTQ